MFDIPLHRMTMLSVLKAIYADPEIGSVLGFKGGTAAYLFYDLPRFSVDLDFDLLNEDKKELVFNKIKIINKKTPLVKINLSYASSNNKYSVKFHLGIAMLVENKESMLSNKLAAFLTRKVFAARDAFDLWYFLKNNWPIDEVDITLQTKLTAKEAFQKALEKTEKISKTQMLAGLAELINENQKIFVREHLLKDLAFYLRLYLERY